MGKLVYGAGINDADYVVEQREEAPRVNGKRKQNLVWTCPFYLAWKGMLRRCVGGKSKARQPTYGDVTCCDEWLTFSNFKSWMVQQEWEGKQLDKDIIVVGNRVYNPEACAFVSGATNSFIISSETKRGKWPLGVYWCKDSFRAQCRNPFTKKREYLGCHNTPEEAHEAWRKRKHELAQLVAATETDMRVVEALKKRYSVEEWYSSDVKY